jgi:hypothetical protein
MKYEVGQINTAVTELERENVLRKIIYQEFLGE